VAVDPRPDIQKVIGDYAAALESRTSSKSGTRIPDSRRRSRELAVVLRARPQSQATLSITDLNVAGTSADATVSGVYEYDNAGTGRAERRPATFRRRSPSTRTAGGSAQSGKD